MLTLNATVNGRPADTDAATDATSVVPEYVYTRWVGWERAKVLPETTWKVWVTSVAAS